MPQGVTEPSVHSGRPPERAGLINAELVRAQYRNIPTAVAVNAIISGLLCKTHRETVPVERLAWWLVVVYLVATTRYVLWRRFQSTPLTPTSASFWRRLAAIGSGVNGFTWGGGGIFLYAAHSPASQILLLITQFGMGAGAAYASAPPFAAVKAYLQ